MTQPKQLSNRLYISISKEQSVLVLAESCLFYLTYAWDKSKAAGEIMSLVLLQDENSTWKVYESIPSFCESDFIFVCFVLFPGYMHGQN